MLGSSNKDSKMPIIERCDVIPQIDALLAQADTVSGIVGFIVLEISQLEQIRHQYGYDVASELVKTVVEQVNQHGSSPDRVGWLG
jgi:GGDEF domain-containing protein